MTNAADDYYPTQPIRPVRPQISISGPSQVHIKGPLRPNGPVLETNAEAHIGPCLEDGLEEPLSTFISTWSSVGRWWTDCNKDRMSSPARE